VVHVGPHSGLGEAHREVIDWCGRQGLTPAGPRWEIYGPHRDDERALTTEAAYLVS
jgi:effector-binding domain-containing protein